MATNKRVQRKQTKKDQNKKLNSVGYSAKEIKNLSVNERNKELKRITRNEQQQARRKKYVAGWENLGIDKKIISQLNLRNKNPETISFKELREIKNKQKAYRAKLTRERNLIIQNTVYHARTHLALAFTPLNGESVWTTERLKRYTYNTLLKKIRERREQAKNNPSGSNGLTGAFQIMSGDAEDCEEMLENFSQRGYNLQVGKLIRDEYIPLVNRNDWTKREFAELVLCVIAQSPNADVEMHIQAFEMYCTENELPFDDIFIP